MTETAARSYTFTLTCGTAISQGQARLTVTVPAAAASISATPEQRSSRSSGSAHVELDRFAMHVCQPYRRELGRQRCGAARLNSCIETTGS